MGEVPVTTLSGVVAQVTFPVFSRLQDDLRSMKNGVKKSLKSLVYVNFPIMVLLIIIAKPLFLILFTDKWNDAVPYFQILCLPGMLLTLHITNLNILKAAGRSDIYFYLVIPKQIIGIVSIIIGIQFGIIGMLYAMAATSYICLGINAYYSGKVIKYGMKEQFKDVIPTYILSIFVGIITFLLVGFFSLQYIISMIIMIIIYSILYIGISKFLRFEALELFLSIINERVFKKK